MQVENEKKYSWLDKPLSSFIPSFNIETILITVILVLAIVTRFYNIDLRVMSHDEVNHVVPSWDLYQGRIYRHDPVTHGPLQFHLVALSYFIFGDSDFSSRVPSALFSIATVATAIFAFRRYLGRIGALIAGALFLISPYMLYYGRYTRNEAFVALFGILTIYAVLRYLDRGDHFSLILLTAVTALQFATKETSYIYTAQLLLFLAFLFFQRLVSDRWNDTVARNRFILLIGLGLILIIMALGLAVWDSTLATEGDTPTPLPQSGAEMEAEAIPSSADAITAPLIGMYAMIGVAILAFIFAGVLLVRSVGWEKIRSYRTFDLLMLIGTLILPQLSAFPVKFLGWDPLDYSNVGMARTGVFVVIIFALSVVLGLWWKRRLWLINAAVFYSIFTVLYTSFFTNGQGFFTGLIGSLGYWLAQQDVQRGSQPLYYYILVQIPMYEYLAGLGAMLAVFFGAYYRRFLTIPGFSPAHQPELMDFEDGGEIDTIGNHQKPLPVLAFLIYWSVSAILAYSFAGEKMPWLTVHIALPLLLSAAWGFGFLVDIVDWKKVFNQRGLIVVLLIPIFITSVVSVIGSFLGVTPPFQGNTLEQLQSTNALIISFIASVASCAGVIWLLKDWDFRKIISLVMAVAFILMALLTARHAYISSFINYDNAKEYLVYAHAA
ncbi:MAG: TIGR03663 family protein, partial [Anaerolineaceae bacterium]|nr:TIGR03663 family protein [Anaerolineaceae bacterium]